MLSSPYSFAISPLVSFFMAIFVIIAMLRMKMPLDFPNQRSLHQIPTPRTGGFAIMVSSACGWILLWPEALSINLLLALALGIIFLTDDVRGLPVIFRFVVQITSASLLVWLSTGLSGEVVISILLILSIVWMTNLYNFMDGSDGLAGGMTFFGFGFYTLAAWIEGETLFAATSACVAAASGGFLFFNFHPARIFMGDGGSIPLGFLAAALGLAGWQEGIWSITFPILVFSPFIVDASITLAKRLLRGEKIWQAHREHYYQRLVQLGFGHRRTALLEYAVMIGCGLSGLLSFHSSLNFQIPILAFWAVFYGLVARYIDKAWRCDSKKPC